MKFSKVGIVLFILVITGTAVFAFNLRRQEEKQTNHALMSKGDYLTSLIALYPVKTLQTERREFFLRTLAEYTSSQGFLYFFLHDQNGSPLVSLIPEETKSLIPSGVRTKSLFAQGLIRQVIELKDSEETIYEFAKPVFEGGQKKGTVRLGFKLSPVPIFSQERIRYLAMFGFFMFAAATLAYYGISLAIQPLLHMHKAIKHSGENSDAGNVASKKNGRIGLVIRELEQSLSSIQEKLHLIEKDNTELSSRLSVSIFEKKQTVKILDSIHFGIIITDFHDNISYINEPMLKLLDRSKEEVVDRSLGEILHNEALMEFISKQDTLARNHNNGHFETSFPEMAPGDIFSLSVTYLANNEKDPLGKILSFNNITRENLTEQAQQEFIAHVAHELLTPLTNIKAYSEMLMDGEIEDAEMQKEFYNTINEQTNRLTELIQNLLSISKMEMGSLTLNKGLVRTDWFVDDCMKAIEGTVQDKNLTVNKELPDVFPNLIADKELLKIAIINILGNAVKYTPQNGTVTFVIAEHENMVRFETLDTGFGISEEDLPHVFDRFYRSGNPEITEQMGSGLGLALTAEIVHLHDGEIKVQSVIGQGSQFSIDLPKEDYQIANQ